MKISYDNLLNKEFLLENYVEKKMTLAEIGRIIGCKSSTPIVKCLKKYGIKIRYYNNGSKISAFHSILTKEFLIDNYINLKMKPSDIAEMVGCSTGSIFDAMEKFCIKKRSYSETNKGKPRKVATYELLTPEFLKEKYEVDCLSMIEIAELVGCTNELVGYYLKKYGIKTRGVLEASRTERHIEKVSGKNNPQWNGGVSPLYKIIRNSYDADVWRDSCFKRDNYRCRDCGIFGNNGEGLEVHHSIKPFIVILREFLNEYNQFSQLEEKDILARLASKYTPFWDLENGKTLCQDCHRGYMGKTFKEVLEFKKNIKGVL